MLLVASLLPGMGKVIVCSFASLQTKTVCGGKILTGARVVLERNVKSVVVSEF